MLSTIGECQILIFERRSEGRIGLTGVLGESSVPLVPALLLACPTFPPVPPLGPPSLPRVLCPFVPSTLRIDSRPSPKTVRPDFSFRDAVLSKTLGPSSSPQSFRPVASTRASAYSRGSSLPPIPPRFLLNSALIGRCFRCFLKGHRAAACRGPRRCLLCMSSGHPASRCRASLSPRSMESGSPVGLQRLSSAFLPARDPPPGRPPLSGCVARLEAAGLSLDAVKERLPMGLAGFFGGAASDYPVASFQDATWAVFFPSWVSRESAIGRSPLRFEGTNFHFSNWVKSGEGPRGHLLHKVWIRLVQWPILCWNEEDLKAAISNFGELWEVDPISSDHLDVSFFRVNVRCRDVRDIPEVLNLMVEDRCFCVPIEIESWVEAQPILLGESLDQRLGLDSLESQDRFIRQTGFSSVPAAGAQIRDPARRSHSSPGLRQGARRVSGGGRWFRSEFGCVPAPPDCLCPEFLEPGAFFGCPVLCPFWSCARWALRCSAGVTS